MPISYLSFQVIHAKKRSQWITLFEIASRWSTSQAYWMTLALISNIANYLKYNYFWDCDGIDNVTLRLWKFSDFCSRHIVGVAGDDIMFHILVHSCFTRSQATTSRRVLPHIYWGWWNSDNDKNKQMNNNLNINALEIVQKKKKRAVFICVSSHHFTI